MGEEYYLNINVIKFSNFNVTRFHSWKLNIEQ